MQSNFSASRAQFLRGKWRGNDVTARPPWALTESQFIDVCDGCGKCISVCQTGILVKARGRYPQPDFTKGECTFCKACLDSCPTGALTVAERPWSYLAEIKDNCLSKQGVTCRTCGDTCESGAITFQYQLGGISLPHVKIENCSGCGACVSPCPVNAIEIKTPTNSYTKGAQSNKTSGSINQNIGIQYDNL